MWTCDRGAGGWILGAAILAATTALCPACTGAEQGALDERSRGAAPTDSEGARAAEAVEPQPVDHLGPPCPAIPALEDLHAIVWLLEHPSADPDRRASRERLDRTREEIDRSTAPGWASFAAALQEEADRPGGVRIDEVEELRARLHASPCLEPEVHRDLHRRLDDPLGLGRQPVG